MPKVAHDCKTCHSIFDAYACDHRVYCSIACVPKGHLKKHGESRSRLHGIWCHMKTRCNCPTVAVYRYYGARGITVCQQWDESYVAFRDWAMASCYEDDLELDRIDVNGNYCPENCRWATRLQQMANTRKPCNAMTSRFKGVSWNRTGRNWKVQIVRNGKNTYVGVYQSEVEAAMAYDKEARRLRGEYARLNFQEHGGVPS